MSAQEKAPRGSDAGSAAVKGRSAGLTDEETAAERVPHGVPRTPVDVLHVCNGDAFQVSEMEGVDREKASQAKAVMTWEVAGDVGDGGERHPDVTVPVRVVLAQVLGVLRVA